MRWWWFGGNVQAQELQRELRVMKAAGIGGVEIQPVYPLELDDSGHGSHNAPYLSADFLKNIGLVSRLTAALGLRLDVTLGSGWPFGGPRTPVTEAAARLRVDRVAVENHSSLALPALENSEKLLAEFLVRGDRQHMTSEGAVRLQDVSNGRVRLPLNLSGPHTVLFFISSRTGQQVKRASVGAEGFVLDHYFRAAIEHHLQNVATPLLASFGTAHPYAVFSDSLEVFGSDWTGNLPAEFQRRRGYDLIPHLPALVEDGDANAPAYRHDWGQTLTELAEENYLKPIAEWAHAHSTRFRSQTYGEPPVILSSNELVDLPEGEGGPRWRTFSNARWAASASHIYGRPVTSSETWTWLHSPAFRATPLDMKAEADLHFLQGVNQLVGHGWPYSPERAGEPGWRFYAAAALNEHNPWFAVMPELNAYLQRASFLLRQGTPANDIAVYLPTDDAWSHFRPGKASVDKQMDSLLGPQLIPQVLDAGLNFDFVDDRALAKTEMRWKAIVLPHVDRMPEATRHLLQRFQAGGGTVVSGPDFDRQLLAVMRPDFDFGDKRVGFLHRKLANGDLYFVANTSNQSVSGPVRFRAATPGAERWDLFTGSVHPVDATSLTLAPYESRLFFFSSTLVGTQPDAEPAATNSIDLNEDWNVTFSRMHQAISMPHLHSWSEDEATRFYSGEAIYEKSVRIPDVRRALLDFGEGEPVAAEEVPGSPGMRAMLESPVREIAIVFVNGERAGSVWHPPYRLDITPHLHRGTNRLRIVVANTAINQLAGSSLPSYKLLNLRYGERFVQQGYESLAPLPSGLLQLRLVITQ